MGSSGNGMVMLKSFGYQGMKLRNALAHVRYYPAATVAKFNLSD